MLHQFTVTTEGCDRETALAKVLKAVGDAADAGIGIGVMLTDEDRDGLAVLT